MLGVFLFPVFVRLGHECQDLLSPCDGMHVCTDWTSVYTLIRKSFGGVELEPMLTPKKNPPPPSPTGGSEEGGTYDVVSPRARMHHKVVGNFGSEADVRSLYYRRFRFNETSDVGACAHGRPEK